MSGASGTRLGVVGYGRFGRALCELGREHGCSVSAFDPRSEVPAEHAARDLAELASRAAIVVVCVPVDALSASLAALRPHVDERHLVLDVSSVKCEPARRLDAELGDVPHAATHPLFGPDSLARGERPLRVVVCPRGEHDAAAARATRFWRSLDCDVIEQTAEEHDRAMARSHALAFFLARGLMELGLGDGGAFTPPSFEAIERTIDAVRSDAGHLYETIQRGNPFAAEARGELLEALGRLHEELLRPAPERAGDDPALAPSSASPSAHERDPRDLLAELDGELLELLRRRAVLEARVEGPAHGPREIPADLSEPLVRRLFELLDGPRAE